MRLALKHLIIINLFKIYPHSKLTRPGFLTSVTRLSYYWVAVLMVGLALLVTAPPSAQASTIYYLVTNNLDNGSNTSPLPNSLRAALVDANSHQGTSDIYAISFNFSASTTITLQNPLPNLLVKTIITGPTNLQITVSGNNVYRPFFVNGAKGSQLTISNLTIAHGKAPSNSSPNTPIPDANLGGAIYAYNTATIINNVTFYDNHAAWRGGALMTDLGSTVINNSTFYANSTTAARGPAGGDGGGAVYVHPSLSNAPNQLNIANSTFYNNAVYPRNVQERGGSGGAILNGLQPGGQGTAQGRLFIKDSVVAHNFADYGGGPDIDSDNYATTTTGVYTSLGYNFIGDGSGVAGDYNGTPPQNGQNGDQVGTHANPLNPLLGSFQDNGGPSFTLAPLPFSPLIDRSNPTGCNDAAQNPVLLTSDQRNFARTSDSLGTGTARCDVGAFEVQPPKLSFTNSPQNFTPSQPWLFQGAGGTLSDLDNSGFTGGSLEVSVEINGAPDDTLGINNQGTDQGQVGVSGNTLTYSGLAVGTFNTTAGTNAKLTIKFTGDGLTSAVLVSIIDQLTFTASASDPAQRTLTVGLTDSSGGKSVPTSLVLNESTTGCGPFVVSATEDDGSGTTCGTLSYALTQPVGNDGVTISFNLGAGNTTLTLSGNLVQPVARNVTITGGDCGSPGIVINGNGKTGLKLSGNDKLVNLWIKNFANQQLQILAPSGGNQFKCVRLSHN